jgi:ATP-dependent protease ClpP protease subunit
MGTERYRSLSPATDLPQLKAVLERRTEADGQQGWYSIKNLSEAEAEVMIYDYIGFGGVSPDAFIRDLADIKAPKISIRVNSPGGDVFDGFAIFNAIRRHKAEMIAYVDGIAASAASFLIMAADEVVMSPHAQLMIHDAHGLALGPADEMRKMADILDKASDNIASVYADRAGGTVEEWRERMKAESWLTDHEAVALKLADRVDGEELDEAKIAARADWAPEEFNLSELKEAAVRPNPAPSLEALMGQHSLVAAIAGKGV